MIGRRMRGLAAWIVWLWFAPDTYKQAWRGAAAYKIRGLSHDHGRANGAA
jgi:hypothetical protein